MSNLIVKSPIKKVCATLLICALASYFFWAIFTPKASVYSSVAVTNAERQSDVDKNKTINLYELIDAQNKDLKDIKLQLSVLSGQRSKMTFETWCGILLACVGIAVTVLAVMIGVLSFWGFNNIKAEANKIAEEKTLEAAEKKLEEHIRNGGFDRLVQEAVDKVAFSNIRYSEGESE